MVISLSYLLTWLVWCPTVLNRNLDGPVPVVRMVKDKITPQQEADIDAMVTAIDELPAPKRNGKDSIYDKIFSKVVASEDKLFKIEVPNKTMKSLYSPFDFRLKKYNKTPERQFNIEIKVRNKTLYLVKTEKKD
jgi:hypothetical protein